MYGVETVGVFAVCVVCAFLMGMGAGSVIDIGENRIISLSNVS